MHPGIKLRHIRLFLAICEEGSISGGARRLAISQPSASKALAELEVMLAAKLVERVGRGIGLTLDGVAFRRTASEALRRLEIGAAALGSAATEGTLRIGCLPTVAGGFVPDVALRLSDRRPDLRMTVLTGSNTYLLALLRSGEIDLVVGRMPATDDIAGLSFDWLYDEEIVLAVRAGHPMKSSKAVEAVRACRIILPPPHAIIRRHVQEFLTAEGILDPDVAFETVSLATGRRLLERSDMVWFISKGVVARDLDEGFLAALSLDAPFMGGAVGITRKRDLALSEEVRRLVDALHEAALTRGGSGD